MTTKASGSMRNLSPVCVGGFTLLEIIIVLLLITVMLAMSVVLFSRTLPSNSYTATVREISATIRYARAMAQLSGEEQTVVISTEGQFYRLEGKGEKHLAPDITIRVFDPIEGEVKKGEYAIVFHTSGQIEGGSIEISNAHNTTLIDMDPVMGPVTVKQ